MKQKKKPMTKDVVPDNFTMSLAIVDAIPVLFFCASMILLGTAFRSALFLFGAGLMFLAGAFKVLWKVIVVLWRRNIWWMFLQLRVLMPFGMILIIASLVIDAHRIDGASILAAVTAMPAVVFFGSGITGMLLMTVFAVKLDSADVRSNWIEQITNGIAQICIFIGIWMCIIH